MSLLDNEDKIIDCACEITIIHTVCGDPNCECLGMFKNLDDAQRNIDRNGVFYLLKDTFTFDYYVAYEHTYIKIPDILFKEYGHVREIIWEHICITLTSKICQY